MLQHYKFPLLELRALWDDNASNLYDDKVGVKELKCPVQTSDLNPSEHFWNELERWLHQNMIVPSAPNAHFLSSEAHMENTTISIHHVFCFPVSHSTHVLWK